MRVQWRSEGRTFWVKRAKTGLQVSFWSSVPPWPWPKQRPFEWGLPHSPAAWRVKEVWPIILWISVRLTLNPLLKPSSHLWCQKHFKDWFLFPQQFTLLSRESPVKQEYIYYTSNMHDTYKHLQVYCLFRHNHQSTRYVIGKYPRGLCDRFEWLQDSVDPDFLSSRSWVKNWVGK